MTDSARVQMIVEWSDDDGCYVGSAPDVMYGGCHGDDRQAVLEELGRIVEEVLALQRVEGIRPDGR